MKPVLTDEEIQAAVHHAYLDLTHPDPEGTDWIDKHPKEWANKAARYAERLTRERMMELVCPWCGSADLPATNCCDEQGRQRSGRITRAEYLHREEER